MTGSEGENDNKTERLEQREGNMDALVRTSFGYKESECPTSYNPLFSIFQQI